MSCVYNQYEGGLHLFLVKELVFSWQNSIVGIHIL